MAEENNQTIAAGKDNKKYTVVEIISIIVLASGILWTLSLFFNLGRNVQTNNAQVDAELVAVTSRISGIIGEIRFNAYGSIMEGDTLIMIDDEEFKIKVDQASADLEASIAGLEEAKQAVETSRSHEAAANAKLAGYRASLERAEKNYARYENMFADSAVTRNQYDQVVAQWKTDQAYLEAGEKELLASRSVRQQNEKNVFSAAASVKRKEADLEAAKLQLSYTVICSPSDGIAGEKTIFTGELLNANQQVLEIVPQKSKWVIANFKETQLKGIREGQEAVIKVDALGGIEYKGRVRNISPATGAKFSMVAPDNSTGNFVKITQRIPVLIDFESSPDELGKVKPGMNVTVRLIK